MIATSYMVLLHQISRYYQIKRSLTGCSCESVKAWVKGNMLEAGVDQGVATAVHLTLHLSHVLSNERK